MQNENVNENEKVVEDNNQYIETIKKMKETTVSKEEYDRLKEENKQLLDSVINGTGDVQVQTEEPVDLDKLRDSLFNQDNSNLEYVEKALKLRQAIIDAGGVDPFIPNGSQISPTDDDIRKAEQVAQVLQECVDYADGDSSVFTNELQRRTIICQILQVN